MITVGGTDPIRVVESTTKVATRAVRFK
jgi:hypothetical protein